MIDKRQVTSGHTAKGVPVLPPDHHDHHDHHDHLDHHHAGDSDDDNDHPNSWNQFLC